MQKLTNLASMFKQLPNEIMWKPDPETGSHYKGTVEFNMTSESLGYPKLLEVKIENKDYATAVKTLMRKLKEEGYDEN